MDEGRYKTALLTVESVQNILRERNTKTEDYEKQLVSLGELVTLSSQSQEFRDQIASDNEILQILVKIVENTFGDGIPGDVSTFSLYVRIIRGVLLLVRNLVITNQFIEISLVLSSLQRFKHEVQHNNELYPKTVVVYMQCLANLSHNTPKDNIVTQIVQTIFDDSYLMKLIEEEFSLKFPFTMFLKGILQNSDNLYDIMTFDDTILVYIIKQFDDADIHSEELDQYSSLLIFTYQIIVSHESYNKWLGKMDSHSDEFLKIMKLNQIIVTSREDWDNYQLTAILAWVFDYFKYFSQESKDILSSQDFNPQNLKRVHLNLVILLDCLSDLGKFEPTKQFLKHYNAIEEFVSLLRVVHENVERKTLKKKEKIEQIDETKKEFPQAKSLIIEIIAYLVHESFEMQEKMRELHGLELVLSNCMIDDNDPFIKERAIVCIKFLLANNQKNQQFVADLEAKQAIDDNALRDVGYEVQIQDGKVKLKQTEGQNLQDTNIN